LDRHKRMRDPGFRDRLWARRFDPHVAPVNRLVDDLARQRRMRLPYVCPLYGGVEARVLFLFQDPGPGTDDAAKGSGFLSSENNDPSAMVFAQCMDAAGLDVSRALTWNSYPWFLPTGMTRPNKTLLREGVRPLLQLLDLLPGLKAVCPMGGPAIEGWALAVESQPALASRYAVFNGRHTSPLGIRRGLRETREEGIAFVTEIMKKARDASA